MQHDKLRLKNFREGNKMHIEKAEPSDVQEILRLNAQIKVDTPVFQGSSAPWIVEQLKNGNYFVMRDEDRICGAFCVLERDGKFHLETIAVDKNVHGKGIGKKFVDFAITKAKEKGFSSLVVDTFCEYKVDGFYEHIGFRKIPTFAQYRGKPYHRLTMNVPG